jgi:hypothetical protein
MTKMTHQIIESVEKLLKICNFGGSVNKTGKEIE